MIKKLKVLSLFSGIGAFEKALTNLEVDYEVVGFSEIDKHAIKSYCAIHDVDETLNLGDISKLNIDKLPKNIDLLTHGSPCTDYSMAGKQKGGDKGSGTQSSLMWYSVEIIKHCKPKYVIWENVKNILSPKHKHNFEQYIENLKNMGYTSYYKVLNAKDYGIPQNRERIFCVSILDKHEPFVFPEGFKLKKDLSQFIDFREKDDITMNFYKRYLQVKGKISYENFIEYINKLPIKKGVGVKIMDLYTYNEMNTITTIHGLTGTLTKRGVQNYCKKFWYNNKLYKPSPKMCWRLMGFTDEDFNKVKGLGTDSQLWDRAGNSIVVNVVEEIFKKLLPQYIS